MMNRLLLPRALFQILPDGGDNQKGFHDADFMPLSAAILSSMGGCVENIFIKNGVLRVALVSAPKGLCKKRWAVALVAVARGRE